MCKYYSVIIFLTSILHIAVGSAPIVDTTHGKVKGKVFKTLLEQKEYYGYMGIPYAEPPIGEFRFLPPRPLKQWDDVLSATQDKRPCLQYNYNVKKGQPLGYYGTPDCLYLDIFAPAEPHTPLPLIVFLYNEQFRQSHNKTKDYSPDFFIENDVLIATISHRLSVFGFLSLEDELLHGNSGLRDIVAALKWIRNNAERFGGDPNRITLMGSQGGAAAAELLIHSKERNLFNSVILQGGTAFESMYLKNGTRDRALKLAKIFRRGSSASDRLLKALNEISFGDLLEKEFQANPQDYCKEHQRGLLPFGPVVEPNSNGLITNYPELSETVDIPIMIGFNSREGLEKSLQYLIEPNFLGSVNSDFVLLLPWRVDFRFDPLDSSYEEAVHEIKRFYFPNGRVTVGNIAEYVTYIGDVTMSAIDHATKHYANKRSRVFYYHFDHYSELNDNMNDLLKLAQGFNNTGGAATGDELCYLFKCPNLKKKYLELREEMPQAIVQKKLVRMWSNFAKYGEPTPAHDTLVGLKWPPYNIETKEYLHIGNEIETKSDLYRPRFEFWEKFIAKWQSRAIGGMVRTVKDEL